MTKVSDVLVDYNPGNFPNHQVELGTPRFITNENRRTSDSINLLNQVVKLLDTGATATSPLTTPTPSGPAQNVGSLRVGTLAKMYAGVGPNQVPTNSLLPPPQSRPSTPGIFRKLGRLAALNSVTAALVTFLRPLTGAVNRTLASILSDLPVTPLDFGAAYDGITDDTVAFQAAVATGKTVYCPAGMMLLNSPTALTAAINFTTAGQLIEGDGPGRTIIKVGTSHAGIAVGAPTTGTTGIFKYNSGEPGPYLARMTIFADQTNTVNSTNGGNPSNPTGLADFNQYPPAIWCAYASTSLSQARFILEDVQIYGFVTGIDMRGNNPATLQNVELGNFGDNILIDGAQDVVQMSECRFYPFGANVNQQPWYFAASCKGINCKRADGLFLTNCMFINGVQVALDTSAASAWSVGGGCFGTALACEFDSFTGVTGNDTAAVGGCSYNVVGGFLSQSIAGVQGVNFAAGNCCVYANVFNAPADTSSVACSGGNIAVGGNIFNKAGGTLTNAVIIVTSGTGVIVGNMPAGAVTAGTFISTAAGSQFHRVGFNGKNTGWTNSLGTNTNAVYANN